MYRLVLDVPLGEDLYEAREKASRMLHFIEQACEEGVKDAQYRLTKDDDRGAKNYMNMVEGRAMGAKLPTSVR